MSSVPDQPEQHDSGERKKDNPRQDQSLGEELFTSRLKEVLSGQRNDVDAFPPSLPPKVAEVAIRELQEGKELNDAQLDLQEVGKFVKTINSQRYGFGKYEGKNFHPNYEDLACVYWILEHFSDEQFQMSEEQRQELRQRTYSVERPQSSIGYFLRSSEEPTQPLEYCYYLLVRLLAIKQKLQQRQRATPETKEHIAMLHDHCFLVLEHVNQLHKSGIKVEDPKRFMEDKLLQLGKSHPELKPQIIYLLQHWDEWKDECERVHREHYDYFFGKHKLQSITPDQGSAQFLQEREEDIKLMNLLRTIEGAMTPENDDDPAWDQPLEYVENLAKDRQAVFINAYNPKCDEGSVSNGQQFQLAVYKALARKGFRKWLFIDELRPALVPIQEWLKTHDDNRSIPELTNLLSEYMQQRRGRGNHSLRSFMLLPTEEEPEQVTDAIRYFEALWDAKEEAGAALHIPAFSEHEERHSTALEWLKSDTGQFICIGYVDQKQCGEILDHSSHGKEPVFLTHDRARPHDHLFRYSSGVIIEYVMNHVADVIGKKRGHGIYQTSAVTIQGNGKLLKLFAGDIQKPDGSPLNAGTLQFYSQDGKRFIDARIFSAEREEDDSEEEKQPLGVETGNPVMSAR